MEDEIRNEEIEETTEVATVTDDGASDLAKGVFIGLSIATSVIVGGGKLVKWIGGKVKNREKKVKVKAEVVKDESVDEEPKEESEE